MGGGGGVSLWACKAVCEAVERRSGLCALGEATEHVDTLRLLPHWRPAPARRAAAEAAADPATAEAVMAERLKQVEGEVEQLLGEARSIHPNSPEPLQVGWVGVVCGCGGLGVV